MANPSRDEVVKEVQDVRDQVYEIVEKPGGQAALKAALEMYPKHDD